MDVPAWYMKHSPNPCLGMAALHEPQLGVTFTAFWPCRDISKGELVGKSAQVVSIAIDKAYKEMLLWVCGQVRPSPGIS